MVEQVFLCSGHKHIHTHAHTFPYLWLLFQPGIYLGYYALIHKQTCTKWISGQCHMDPKNLEGIKHHWKILVISKLKCSLKHWVLKNVSLNSFGHCFDCDFPAKKHINLFNSEIDTSTPSTNTYRSAPYKTLT